jgi:hypothetical protein
VLKKEVNWQEYYAHIKSVCPWSYKAYMNDNILVWENATSNTWQTVSAVFDSTNFEAIVYRFDNHSPEQLDALVSVMSDRRPNSEFLWSHPDADSGDDNSTPVPVIIQQNKEALNDLREKLTGEHNE